MDKASTSESGSSEGLTRCCRQCEAVISGPWGAGEPHDRADRPGVACRFVWFFDLRYLPGAVADVHHPIECFTEEIVDCDPADTDLTAVALAIQHLSEERLEREASGRWFFDPDGFKIVDPGTGERSEVTAHLHGFTKDEEGQINLGVELARDSYRRGCAKRNTKLGDATVDPDEALSQLIDALVEGDVSEATEHFEDLANWISHGGGAPLDPRR